MSATCGVDVNKPYTNKMVKKNKANRQKPYTKPGVDGYENGFVRGHDDNGYKGHDEDKAFIATPITVLKTSYEKDDAIAFLLGCGISKALLDLLPEKLLVIFERSKCQLCAISFTSESLAITHYKSKGHIKKTRQWLMAESEKNNTTVPENLLDLLVVKTSASRWNILCELCGVRLTSKIQTESHISGKIHKGILEGKKQPRYPNSDVKELDEKLMKQIGEIMEQEKLSPPVLKNIPSLKSFDIPQPHTPPPPAPKDPALYCEVCDKYVNHAEQLLVHKNGKKHINKEKLFIQKLKESKAEELSHDPFKV